MSAPALRPARLMRPYGCHDGVADRGLVRFWRDTQGAVRLGLIEIAAAILTLIWFAAIAAWAMGLLDRVTLLDNVLGASLVLLGVLLPVGVIWLVAALARAARVLRQEAADIRTTLDLLQQTHLAAPDPRPDPEMLSRIEELEAQNEIAQTRLASFTSLRATDPAARAAVPLPVPPSPDSPQGDLSLIGPSEALMEPISRADFIRALDFPADEHDKEGFRTLRRALEDPATRPLIRAAQTMLTLLAQDGIYMDDLTPDRARPEIWRRFGEGARGRAIAPLGGVRDRASLALATARLKKDDAFRDATHHFLREFDRVFGMFLRDASDADIVGLAATRSARAFMIMGRVTGMFD